MIRLGVNIDHVATVREARRSGYPDPVKAALLCQAAGADSIVCHLREDRRHIQDKDLYRLKKALDAKLNLEMACSEEIVKIAAEVRPRRVTLVPEKRRELTTEGGLDVCSRKPLVRKTLERMRKADVEVSLFIDPDARQINASREAGANMIELHTGEYANAKNIKEAKKKYTILEQSAKLAGKLGFKVFAGHGLDYGNTARLTGIKEIEEYNIGHSIIARAVFVGIEQAVREMKKILARSRVSARAVRGG